MGEVVEDFRRFCIENEYYDEETLKTLLDQHWDGAYPTELLGDDLKTDIANFLYYMADFALTKVQGERNPMREPFSYIIPDPSYEDRSSVWIVHIESKTLVARGCGCKTWNHSTEVIEEDLKELIDQVQKGLQLVQQRLSSGIWRSVTNAVIRFSLGQGVS